MAAPRTPHPRYPEITLSVVRDLLDYDRKTGALTWKLYRGPKAPAGALAGMVHPATGAVFVTIFGHKIPASHIVWLLSYNAWPLERLFPRDRDHENLRLGNWQPASERVSKTEQAAQRRKYYRSYAQRVQDESRMTDAQLDARLEKENRELERINRREAEAATTIRHPVTHRKRRTTRRPA